MLHNILIGLFVSIATIFMMYIDSRLFDKPKNKMTYIKNIILVNLVTFSSIFILTWLSPNGNIKDISQTVKKIEGNTTYIKQLGEEMLSGDAPF
jgi:NADH:ubiquinone oxidoreductase subunit 6 (subunit J)